MQVGVASGWTATIPAHRPAYPTVTSLQGASGCSFRPCTLPVKNRMQDSSCTGSAVSRYYERMNLKRYPFRSRARPELSRLHPPHRNIGTLSAAPENDCTRDAEPKRRRASEQPAGETITLTDPAALEADRAAREAFHLMATRLPRDGPLQR